MAKAPNANQALFDALVRHTVLLQRVGDGIRDEIIKLFDGTEEALKEKLLAKLPSIDLNTQQGVDRLAALLAALKDIRQAAKTDAVATWQNKLSELAKAEPEFMAATFNTVSPVVLDVVSPSPEIIKKIVASQPFEGLRLKEWADNMTASELDLLKKTITKGLIDGLKVQDIVRQIVGTVSEDGIDGITERTRRNIQQITRTAVSHVTNEVRTAFYEANSDIVKKEMFVATLDSRTTATCAARDGEIFPVGKGPIPPLHFGCRSVRVAIFDALGVVGQRPFNASTEKRLVRQYAEENGLGSISSRDDLPFGTKSKFDKWARKQATDEVGQVPASTTYSQWLATQPASFQDEVLGPTRAKLFRAGKENVKLFVDANGSPLTLAELASKHAKMFEAAGLDASAFNK